jgi:hypothetical protein
MKNNSKLILGLLVASGLGVFTASDALARGNSAKAGGKSAARAGSKRATEAKAIAATATAVKTAEVETTRANAITDMKTRVEALEKALADMQTEDKAEEEAAKAKAKAISDAMSAAAKVALEKKNADLAACDSKCDKNVKPGLFQKMFVKFNDMCKASCKKAVERKYATGKAEIRYVSTADAKKSAVKSLEIGRSYSCSNDLFGDPHFGFTKKCYFDAIELASEGGKFSI